MLKKITSNEYQNYFKKIIGKKIDIFQVSLAEDFFIGGVSLIHTLDEENKDAYIIGLNGEVSYKSETESLTFNTKFKKSKKNFDEFKSIANIVKEDVSKNHNVVESIVFSDDNNNAVIKLSNGRTLTVTAPKDNKALTFDRNNEFAVYYGQENDETQYFFNDFDN